MALSFRRVGCHGAEQQFDQGLDQLVVLAGWERGGGGIQQGKVELCERRLSAELSFRPSLGGSFSEALAHFGSDGKALSKARSSNNASVAISGGPSTNVAQAVLSIHVGNPHVAPLSIRTKTYSPHGTFWRLRTGKLCP
jgi:hypothetical protein